MTFAYTGGDQIWTVPAGVTSATFDVYGAQGGAGNLQPGGEGGEVTTTLPLTSGGSFEIVVGGQGGSISNGSAGFNGGGAGGEGGASNNGPDPDGGGGGGASDVRTGSCAATASCADGARILVGGGGGGSVGTGGTVSAPGGAGANPSGAAGGSNGNSVDSTGGGGGTQGAPGPHGDVPAGASPCPSSDVPATAGMDATGADGGAGGNGDGSPTAGDPGTGGGGGGGGYFGGGGGGGGTCLGVSGGGGGGSSFGPSGATFNNGAKDGNGVVVITYAAAQTTMTSTAAPDAGPTGSTLQDSATLANTDTPDGTGSITFNLYGPGDTGCATSLFTTTVAAITADGPWSTTSGNVTTGYVPATAGTYNWTASFSGDSANDAATTTCGDEPVVITAQPSVSTTATPNAGPTGSTLQDSATLANTGALDGTGSVTFKLYRPGDISCATPIHTETVTGVSSDGPFTTTTGYVTNAPGTYNWTASFSGDSNNAAASTTCGAEPVVITAISQITSASTTCGQFAGSGGSTIAQIKYSSKNGKIKSATPGGFEYWLTLTANGGSQSFTVTQLSNEKSRPFLLAPGSSAYSTSCGAVPITITTQGNGAVVTFAVPASASGLTYYVGLDFSTGNVIGEANPKPKSTVKYQFITGGVLGSTRDLTLAKSD